MPLFLSWFLGVSMEGYTSVDARYASILDECDQQN